MTDTLSIDVSEWIDRHRVAPFQAAIVVLCFLIVAIDGFDTASIGFIAPSSARNGAVARAARTGVRRGPRG